MHELLRSGDVLSWLSLRCIIILIFLSEIPCTVLDDEICNQFIKVFSQTSFAYLGKAKHIISITVHLFVLIKRKSQQVPPHSSGGCRAVESTRKFVPHFVSVRPQAQRAQTALKS